ncbi:arginine decarboxylase, partial [Stenotrophomonas sp. M37]|nr:arginine decarboxylase [Stenotrophomonas sp. M37]
MTDWSLDQARKTSSLPHGADGYFDVAPAGHLGVRPTGADGPGVALPKVVDAARAAGATLPLLVR